jgi:hypothetical protein
MSDRPPRDPDDLSLGGLVDEVVSQVKVALDEADVTAGRSRDMLIDGLRDVLEAMDPASLARKRRPTAPDVEVVQGGRSDDAPPTEGLKPDLKVAEPEEVAETEDVAAPNNQDTTASPKVVTRVVVKKSTPSAGQGRPRVHLPESGAWRSLFRGTVARAYRLHAVSGSVRVQLNGMPADVLEEGDSLDVEARVVQVSARDAAAVVAYDRLG